MSILAVFPPTKLATQRSFLTPGRENCGEGCPSPGPLEADKAWLLATNATGRCCETNGFTVAHPPMPSILARLPIARASYQGRILMKMAIVSATALLLFSISAQAQGDPSGRGSTTGDPAASSANPSREPAPRGRSTSNPSGSGTSSSGGRDANGDQGRDTMPETAKQPTPQAQQKGLPK